MALAVALVLALTACADEDEGRVAYWAVNMGPTLAEYTRLLEQELAEFTDQTDVEVDLEVIDWVDLYQRVMTAIGSGRTPDVVNIGNSWSASLQDTGALLSFDDAAMAAIGGAEKFLAPTLTATGVPGEPPASIPFLGQAHALYYSPSLLAEAGIDGPPATWDELVTAARALNEQGIGGLAIGAGSAARNAHLTFIVGRQHGATLFDSDGKARFDTQQLRAAVRTLIDLVEEGVLDPTDVERDAPTDNLAALAQGRVAMAVHQANGRGYFASVGYDDYAVAPLPTLDPLPEGGVPVRSMVAGTNLAVFADTDRRNEALQLVEFLTSPHEQVVFNQTFGTLPVVHAAYDDETFSEPSLATFRRILNQHAETMPMVSSTALMEQVLGGAVRDLIAEAVTDVVTDAEIAGALDRAEGQMTES